MDEKDTAQSGLVVQGSKAHRPAAACLETKPPEPEAASYDPELVEALDALDRAEPEHTATSAADTMAWLRGER